MAVAWQQLGRATAAAWQRYCRWLGRARFVPAVLREAVFRLHDGGGKLVVANLHTISGQSYRQLLGKTPSAQVVFKQRALTNVIDAACAATRVVCSDTNLETQDALEALAGITGRMFMHGSNKEFVIRGAHLNGPQ